MSNPNQAGGGTLCISIPSTALFGGYLQKSKFITAQEKYNFMIETTIHFKRDTWSATLIKVPFLRGPEWICVFAESRFSGIPEFGLELSLMFFFCRG